MLFYSYVVAFWLGGKTKNLYLLLNCVTIAIATYCVATCIIATASNIAIAM